MTHIDELVQAAHVRCSELAALQKDASTAAEKLMIDAEKTTTSYRYAVGCESLHLGYFNPSPVTNLIIGGYRRGRLLKNKPKSGKYAYIYGFDADGRLLSANNEFYQYKDDVVCTYTRPQPNGQLYWGMVTSSTYSAGRIVLYEQMHGPFYSCEVYEYDNDHHLNVVHLIEVTDTAHPFFQSEEKPGLARYSQYRVNCLPDGTIETIICAKHFGKDTDYLVYTRPIKENSLSSIEARLLQTMLKAIPATIKKLGITEPAYTVIINYDMEHDPMPPILTVGTASDLQHLKEQYGDSVLSVFSAGDMESYWINIDTDDPQFMKNCEEWNERVQESLDYKRADRLMLRLCSQLQTIKWNEILNTMDGFLVIATDLSMTRLEENLKILKMEPRLAALGIKCPS